MGSDLEFFVSRSRLFQSLIVEGKKETKKHFFLQCMVRIHFFSSWRMLVLDLQLSIISFKYKEVLLFIISYSMISLLALRLWYTDSQPRSQYSLSLEVPFQAPEVTRTALY